MPGPKMGPRPPDFDEALVRQVNTYVLSYFVLLFLCLLSFSQSTIIIIFLK